MRNRRWRERRKREKKKRGSEKTMYKKEEEMTKVKEKERKKTCPFHQPKEDHHLPPGKGKETRQSFDLKQDQK